MSAPSGLSRLAFRPGLLACAVAASLTTVLVPLAPAQTLLGLDGSSGLAWEFTPSAGGPCPEPLPFLAACSYVTPSCNPAFPLPFPPGTILGDIADDPVTDTMFVTDGRVIQQYTLDQACAGAMTCNVLNSINPPSSMGPITGMGFDNTGGVVALPGTPLLWITDGFSIAALQVGPFFSCTYTVVYGPCVITPVGAGPFTDLSWDPNLGGLWASDVAGSVSFINPTTCNVVYSFPVAGACGLFPLLTGLAYDGGTPAVFPLPASNPTIWVTDGLNVARVDWVGLPGAPTFGAPLPCTPAPAFLSGLALTQHGFNYGGNRVLATLDTFGQATTPTANFGIEVFNAPPGANAWLISNFNFPGPGFFCPAAAVASTKLYVNPAPPALILNLGPLPGGCVPIPLPLPSGIPVGVETYIQMLFIPPGGPPAVDATNAVSATIMLP